MIVITLLFACGGAEPVAAPQPEPVAEPQPDPEPAIAAPTQRTHQFKLPAGALDVRALEHGSVLFEYDGMVVASDPVSSALEPGLPKADFILVTHHHGDHLDPEAIATLSTEETIVIAPARAKLADADVWSNGDSKSYLRGRVRIEAVPMYNTEQKRPDSGEPFHPKGLGNGYVISFDSAFAVYVSGDTECVPEVEALDPDLALLSMNLPYTMPWEDAAACVRKMQPGTVIPYHHRGQDITAFANELSDQRQTDVVLLDWYPKSDDVTGAPAPEDDG